MSAWLRTFSNLEKPNITLLKIWNVDEIDGEEVLTLKWEKESYPWGGARTNKAQSSRIDRFL
jgi:hypothetical protein